MADSDREEELRRKAETIAAEVRALPPREQSSSLDEQCSGDIDLRAAVLGLLHAPEPESQTLERFSDRPVGMGLRLEADTRLGPYKIVRPLGSGGMGVVYEAEDTRLGRKVAVKLLTDSIAVNERSQKRFLQEARVASSLDHPNICSIYDVGDSDDGHAFIVMAYYEGETLEQKLRRGPLPVDEARDIAVQTTRALERAHAAGIIHRDIKPANVMVTRDGEVKLLDFGLAKLAGAASLTRTGATPGTLAYMSPEQVKGERDIDGRADIFALGAVLYEMLTGTRPFSAESPPEVMLGILQAEPEPVRELREDAPLGLERIVEKALVKDRDRRYQTPAEMLADLESNTIPKPAPRSRRGRLTWWAAAAAATTLPLLALWVLTGRPPDAGRGADVSSTGMGRPSLAVLRFQNLTGDAGLAWLRSGLAEMLVTELSQSPEIAVTSTARIYESLKANEIFEEAAPSFDQIRVVAREVEARSVVRGSYAHVGEVFRIAVTIEDAATGEILEADQVEGEGAESVFSLVDRIAAVIRRRYEISRPLRSPPTVAAATTSSLEAWRLYSEAIALAKDFKQAEAVVLLDRAVEIDPDFALALVALGATHSEMGHEELADEYLRRALELAERLPVDERYRVEGTYYGDRWSTLERAIEIYEEGLRTYPDKEAWRNNLARRYAFHERYQDAMREFDRLIEEGADFVGDFIDAANVRAALGQMESGYALLSELSSRDEWFAQYVLGWYLTEWGRLDEAESRFQNAERLRPGDWSIPYARWRVAILRENWTDADAEARLVSTSDEPQARWRGDVSLARNALYRGAVREAVALLDDAALSYPNPNAYTALARCWKAELLLETGRPSEALREAELARASGADEFPELKARFVAALAHEALGQSSEADELVRELETLSRDHGRNKVEERQLGVLRGRLALARGDHASGVEALRRAASLLSPKGVEFHWHVYPAHVPVWVALGEAELAAGEPERARAAFALAAETGSERLEHPVPFVRSLYFLGRLALEGGEPERARHFFERFLSHWRNGELDRDRVREALSALGG